MDNQNMTYSYGYELAKSEYEKLSIVPRTSQEWVAFFRNVTQGCPILEVITFERIFDANLHEKLAKVIINRH